MCLPKWLVGQTHVYVRPAITECLFIKFTQQKLYIQHALTSDWTTKTSFASIGLTGQTSYNIKGCYMTDILWKLLRAREQHMHRFM